MAGFWDTMGSAVSGAANYMGDMFSGWGTPSTPTAPLGSTAFGSSSVTPDMSNMAWTASPVSAPTMDTFMGTAGQPTQMGGAMAMPTATPGATGDIANSAAELNAFSSGLGKTDMFGRAPTGTIAVGDYAMTPDQFAQYGVLKGKYTPGHVDQFLGIKSPDAANWFQAKGVPLAKMGLAGGSLYLGSKTADAFKKQMEASQQVAQKNIENQTALINTYMYDRQAARYAANPEGEQTPEEYMAEHGL